MGNGHGDAAAAEKSGTTQLTVIVYYIGLTCIAIAALQSRKSNLLNHICWQCCEHKLAPRPMENLPTGVTCVGQFKDVKEVAFCTHRADGTLPLGKCEVASRAPSCTELLSGNVTPPAALF